MPEATKPPATQGERRNGPFGPFPNQVSELAAQAEHAAGSVSAFEAVCMAYLPYNNSLICNRMSEDQLDSWHKSYAISIEKMSKTQAITTQELTAKLTIALKCFTDCDGDYWMPKLEAELLRACLRDLKLFL